MTAGFFYPAVICGINLQIQRLGWPEGLMIRHCGEVSGAVVLDS